MASFHYCQDCDYIFAANPFWLDEAYMDAIVATDTDIAVRNIFTALRLSSIFFWVLGERGDGVYADAAGGYGLLARLLRDLGFNMLWSDKYAQNLFARGFEYTESVGACTAVSAVEVLEHTPNPKVFIQACFSEFRADTLFFTTELFSSGQPPQAKDWSYFSFETGQHISFFSENGLRKLASQMGLNYYSAGRIHCFTKKSIPGWKLSLATNKFLVVPLSLFAAKCLGSRRATDQSLLIKRYRDSAGEK